LYAILNAFRISALSPRLLQRVQLSSKSLNSRLTCISSAVKVELIGKTKCIYRKTYKVIEIAVYQRAVGKKYPSAL
jgi:hypothetical protein